MYNKVNVEQVVNLLGGNLMKLKELCNVDTLSQDMVWKMVLDNVRKLNIGEERLSIDFTGVRVLEPWMCPSFKELLRIDNIQLVFTNSEELVNKLRVLCVVDGINPDNIVNRTIEIKKPLTEKEKSIERLGSQIIPSFKVTDDTATLNVSEAFDQISTGSTISYIGYAIQDLHKVQNLNKFILIFGKMRVLDDVVEKIAELMVNMDKQGIDVQVELNNIDVQNNLNLYLDKLTSKELTSEEKKAILRSFPINTPGLLIRYKKSKALDDFGRQGHGEVVSSRICIFRGIVEDKTGTRVKIESYNGNDFFTHQHWAADHDGELNSSLNVDKLEISLPDFGFCDSFLGHRYHFLLPIQRDINENRNVIYDVTDDGNAVSKMCTIPERMKLVFDDWGVKYNKEQLDKFIQQTNEELGIVE